MPSRQHSWRRISALWCEVQSDGVARKSLPDTESLSAEPNAEVEVTVSTLNPNKLVGQTFAIQSGNDEVNQSFIARIYYVEHDFLNDNKIEILGQAGNVFHVRWTGTTTDVNYYDGSKPDTKVEIEGDFTFKDMDEWL
jgi:hypothetical protein